MTVPSVRRPVLDALMGAAVAATGAGRGWLLVHSRQELVVVAAVGPDAGADLGARGPDTRGWAGFVLESKRPVALSPDAEDPRFGGDLVVGRGTRPANLLCFPCAHEGRILGALQLIDKPGGP